VKTRQLLNKAKIVLGVLTLISILPYGLALFWGGIFARVFIAYAFMLIGWAAIFVLANVLKQIGSQAKRRLVNKSVLSFLREIGAFLSDNLPAIGLRRALRRFLRKISLSYYGGAISSHLFDAFSEKCSRSFFNHKMASISHRRKDHAAFPCFMQIHGI
jgi:hypothetical protein